MNAVALVLVAATREVLLSVCGESLLSRAVDGLLHAETVRQVIVVSPSAGRAAVQSELTRFGESVQVLTVDPGNSAAVERSLAEAVRTAPETDVVVVQDATRAFTPASLVDDVVRAVRQGAATAVPVLPVTDTIKRVDDTGNVRATVDRSLLRVVQGPQAYGVDVFVAAMGEHGGAVADGIDRTEGPVATVPGHPHAIKIKTTFDLAVARTIGSAEQAMGADR